MSRRKARDRTGLQADAEACAEEGGPELGDAFLGGKGLTAEAGS